MQISGIINVNKPADWTSHDCVAVMRRVLGIKRVGHTGTLDPMATGVLPICIGPATRIMEYLDLDFKNYRCEMQLGKESDTLDIWGVITREVDPSGITEAQIRKAFEPFCGTIQQIPPKYSALKVDGKKLYQYARAGQEVTIKPRQVYIKKLEIEGIDFKQHKITWTVTCSKGTYIRSICRDVGQALGCGAVMTDLVRTASGVFDLEHAIDLETLRSMEQEEARSLLLPPDYPLVHFGKVVLDKDRASYFCNGGHISLKEVQLEKKPAYLEQRPHIPVRDQYRQAYNLYLSEADKEIFLGVAFYSSKYKKLVADKVFYSAAAINCSASGISEKHLTEDRA
ncbi:MAG: tRNA pseudouridine(55) synthase TruB [Firmicutes bacterium]|nr:tRNA pseudouridine(55) synthase TruB [Bacillota bacterium]